MLFESLELVELFDLLIVKGIDIIEDHSNGEKTSENSKTGDGRSHSDEGAGTHRIG